jgi:hypothetical protein
MQISIIVFEDKSKRLWGCSIATLFSRRGTMGLRIGLHKATLIAVLSAILKMLGKGNFVSQIDFGELLFINHRYICLVNLKSDHGYEFVARADFTASESNQVNGFPVYSIQVAITTVEGANESNVFICTYERDGFKIEKI